MVDPTSDLEEDVSEEEAPSCVVCGDAIVESPAHRVTTWIDDGAVRTVHFCDDNCKEHWNGDEES